MDLVVDDIPLPPFLLPSAGGAKLFAGAQHSVFALPQVEVPQSVALVDDDVRELAVLDGDVAGASPEDLAGREQLVRVARDLAAGQDRQRAVSFGLVMSARVMASILGHRASVRIRDRY